MGFIVQPQLLLMSLLSGLPQLVLQLQYLFFELRYLVCSVVHDCIEALHGIDLHFQRVHL